MRLTSLSVPDVVQDVITRNRSIYDCMKMDIINYTALAVKIQPEVEKILGNPVNLNTIVVAIKRYADSFETKEDVKEQSVLRNARLSLTDGILDIRFSLDENSEQEAINLMNKFSELKSDYELFRLPDSFRLLTEDLVDVRQLIESFPRVKNFFNAGLAKIKMRIPQDQNRSDVVSYVAEILHSNGIELINAYFSQDDIIIVLNEKNASRAYELLRTEISR